MLIIPAIDLKNGQCVRLRQGRMEDDTVFSTDPLAVAERWVKAGARRLHLVDLDGAFAGHPMNAEIITAIAHRFPALPIQVGGGIRDMTILEACLNTGVRYAIIGTRAVQEPEFVREACTQFPGRIIVGLDARGGQVATDGWAKLSEYTVLELAKRFEQDGVSAIVFTDIARDGMMQGVNVDSTTALAQAISIPVIASGGITNLDDIKALCHAANNGIIGAITGRAIYEGTLDFSKAQQLADYITTQPAPYPTGL